MTGTQQALTSATLEAQMCVHPQNRALPNVFNDGNLAEPLIGTRVIATKVAQMTRLWGDESWKEAGYDQVPTLFDEFIPRKVSNERFAEAFRQRLVKKAGFKYVPRPMPMKTKNNSVIYYLYFASQKEAGMDIVNDIFDKYRAKQGL